MMYQATCGCVFISSTNDQVPSRQSLVRRVKGCMADDDKPIELGKEITLGEISGLTWTVEVKTLSREAEDAIWTEMAGLIVDGYAARTFRQSLVGFAKGKKS